MTFAVRRLRRRGCGCRKDYPNPKRVSKIEQTPLGSVYEDEAAALLMD